MNNPCTHDNITCLNQYEYIRKYICEDCNEIMMCACDEDFGVKFLSHQISYGTWMNTQKRVPVTLGFQKNICLECRGNKPIAAPKAPMHGYTSKISRYYWREIYFETTRRFFDLHPELDPKDNYKSVTSFPEDRKRIEKEVTTEFKNLHSKCPKYQYNEVSQQEVIDRTNTEIILLNANYVKTQAKKVQIQDGSKLYSVEEYASNYFTKQGYQVIETESTPFHVLFGIYVSLLIHDYKDFRLQVVQFGSRFDYDNGENKEGLIITRLPEDFGTSGYNERRKECIKRHIEEMIDDSDCLFEYWLEFSYELRQYLWAHRENDILKAKQIISIIGLNNLRKVLHYFVMNYWKNYCGWPDLLIYNQKEFFFVEVKSSNDKLSEDQKNWLLGNNEHMGFKVKLLKVGKLKT